VLAVARRSTKEAADSLFKQLLAASEKASGFVSDDIAMILGNQIEFMGYLGRLSECEEMSKRLVNVLQRVYGSDHPEVAVALNKQASIIYNKSKEKDSSTNAEDALPLLRRAAQIRRAAFGANHPLSKLAEENIKTLQNNIKIMHDYLVQRAINKRIYYCAVDALAQLVKKDHINYIVVPMFQKFTHVLHSIQGSLLKQKFPIDTKLDIYKKDDELVAKLQVINI
jgi:hypothetical protein